MHCLFPVANLMLILNAPLFANWVSLVVCASEENLAFTALSSQHALPQDLGSGQVSLSPLYTATRLGSNSICKISITVACKRKKKKEKKANKQTKQHV